MRYLYLHGFASSPASRKAQFFRQRLRERGVDLLVPDLAEGRFESLTLTGQLRVVERALEGQPATLIGSSMGGYLAALFAARCTAVQRALLLAPAFGFANRWPLSLGAERMEQWRRTGSMPVFHHGDNVERRIGYALLEDGRQYEDYPDVRQPVLIFHGSADTVVPADYSRQFARDRANVQLFVLDSDHELGDVLDRIWAEAAGFLLD